MSKFWPRAVVIVFAVITLSTPATVSAGTLSVSQTITVTARVLPARSIVVNDQGQMIRIYSNTDENVTPKVYINRVPGEQTKLTPELYNQYAAILSEQQKVIGVAIEVPLPKPEPLPKSQNFKALLVKSMSILNIPIFSR